MARIILPIGQVSDISCKKPLCICNASALRTTPPPPPKYHAKNTVMSLRSCRDRCRKVKDRGAVRFSSSYVGNLLPMICKYRESQSLDTQWLFNRNYTVSLDHCQKYINFHSHGIRTKINKPPLALNLRRPEAIISCLGQPHSAVCNGTSTIFNVMPSVSGYWGVIGA
jgi:hypothetical protein